MLTIPEGPSGYSLAEGLVMNSTRATDEAGSRLSSSIELTLVGRPSMKYRTLDDPRKVMLPFRSVQADGRLFIRSFDALPEV